MRVLSFSLGLGCGLFICVLCGWVYACVCVCVCGAKRTRSDDLLLSSVPACLHIHIAVSAPCLCILDPSLCHTEVQEFKKGHVSGDHML